MFRMLRKNFMTEKESFNPLKKSVLFESVKSTFIGLLAGTVSSYVAHSAAHSVKNRKFQMVPLNAELGIKILEIALSIGVVSSFFGAIQAIDHNRWVDRAISEKESANTERFR